MDRPFWVNAHMISKADFPKVEFLFNFLTLQDQAANMRRSLKSVIGPSRSPGLREALIVVIFYKACCDYLFNGRLSIADEDEVFENLLSSASVAHGVKFKPAHVSTARRLMASQDATALHIIEEARTALRFFNDPEIPVVEFLASLIGDEEHCFWDFSQLNIMGKTKEKCPNCKRSLEIEGAIGIEYKMECPACKKPLAIQIS